MSSLQDSWMFCRSFSQGSHPVLCYVAPLGLSDTPRYVPTRRLRVPSPRPTYSVANPIYDSVFKYLMEDEYFSAIEKRDTEIMVRDKRIEEQEVKLAEQDHKLAENELKLAEKESQIRALVTALAGKGLSCEKIAALTGCKIEDIKLML